jgi:hypothetical protein
VGVKRAKNHRANQKGIFLPLLAGPARKNVAVIRFLFEKNTTTTLPNSTKKIS